MIALIRFILLCLLPIGAPCGFPCFVCSDTSGCAHVDLAYNRLVSKLDSLKTNFSNGIAVLFNSAMSNLDKASNNPSLADQYIAAANSEYSTGIGDSSTGIFGTLSSSINGTLTEVNSGLTAELTPPHFMEIDAFCQQVPNTTLPACLSDYQNQSQSRVNDLFAYANSVVSDYNTRFSARMSSVASSTFDVRLASMRDKFLSDVAAALVIAIRDSTAAHDSVISLVSNQPDTPSGVQAVSGAASDYNNAVSAIVSALNASLSASYSLFSSSLSAVKYSGDGADAKVRSAYAVVDSKYSSVGSDVSSKIDSFTNDIVEKTKSYVTKVSNAQINDARSSAKSSIQSSIDKHIASLNSLAENTLVKMRAIDNIVSSYLAGSSPESFLDSSVRRSFWVGVDSGVFNSVNAAISSYSPPYNDGVRSIVSAYSADASRVVNEYNSKLSQVAGAVTSDVETANKDVNSAMAAGDTLIQSVVESNNTNVSDYVRSIRSRVKSSISQRKASFPYIRATGNVTLPSFINTTGDTSFSFGVTNPSSVPWNGWFGIIIRDEAGYSHKYNEQSLLTIAPGQTTMVTVNVPTGTLLSGKSISGFANILVLVNTQVGD